MSKQWNKMYAEKLLACIPVFFICLSSIAQDPTKVSIDSLPADSIDIQKALEGKIPNKAIITYTPTQQNKKRLQLAIAASIIGYGGSMAALHIAWYRDYKQTNFHFFNDNAEWLQMDKAGHVFSTYIGSRTAMEIWQYAGWSKKQAVWVGATSGVVYQTIIETLDGFSEGWGWSWGDFSANVLGAGLFAAQELWWNEQRLMMKFSTHFKSYPEGELKDRAKQMFGRKFNQRLLKDYNAQTIWISANLRSFLKQSTLPSWLNIAAGYSAEGMYEGKSNLWKDANGVLHDRTDVPRYRQFYLAPDIDLTRIKTKNKVFKVLLFIANAAKFPTPSLELSQGKMKWNWIHF